METDLRMLAIYLGGTQRDVAAFFGVSTAAVSAWNTGKFKPKPAPRSLLGLAMRIGESDPEWLRQLAAVDPGDKGGDRLTAALGVRETVRLTGGLDNTRTTARLALLVETVQREAPHLLEPAPAVDVVSTPAATAPPWMTAPVSVPAPPVRTWPTTWTSEDGITVAIPEHIQGPTDALWLPYVTGKAAYMRSIGVKNEGDIS